MGVNLKLIEEHFEKLDLKKLKPMEFKWGRVDNPAKTIASHIMYLKANKGNRGYTPYFDRLVDIYNKTK